MSNSNRHRDDSRRPDDLNLAPFMNIVAILIPMLLLSVVFLKAGVIDVSSPSIAPEGEAEDSGDEKLRLTVGMTTSGFEIGTADRTFSPVEDCPADGSTVCLTDQIDVDSRIDEARRALEAGRNQEASAVFDEVVDAYDFAGLYTELRRIKSEHPDERTVRLTASPEIPYKLVVRVMDAVRFKRQKKRYATNRAFWQASVEGGGGADSVLFNQPIVAVGR